MLCFSVQFVFVFVNLSVCVQDNAKPTSPISMTLGGKV